MSIEKWNPFEELRKFEKEFGKIFKPFSSDAKLSPSEQLFTPLTDMQETEKEVIVKMNLPGFKKDEVTIKATSDSLEVKAEKKEEKEEKKGKMVYKERLAQNYYRKVHFPALVDPNTAKTTLNSGVLEITLPKSQKKKIVELKPD
ncbi:MAG: Hsp20/alpha crystallin family protein [Candidatus Hodarchaeota archaeon]